MTSELLHTVLGLPDEVRVSGVSFDNSREIVKIHLASDQEVQDITFPTGEAQEAPDVFYSSFTDNAIEYHYKIYERIRNLLAGVEEGDGIPPDESDVNRES